MSSQPWALQVVTERFDNDVFPFWEGLQRHEFLLYKCQRCSAHYWPMTLCPKHQDNTFEDMSWVPTSGRGTVFSFGITHKATNPAFKAEVPYATILVELDEGPIFPTRLEGKAPENLAIGMRVEVSYLDVPETGLTLPVFKVSSSAS